MNRMNTYMTGILIAVLVSGTPAQDAEDVQDVIYQAPPEPVPPHVRKAPAPLSVRPAGVAGALPEPRNVHDLGPLSDERIAAADKDAARRFTHVHPGPRRVGVVRTLDAPLSPADAVAVEVPQAEGSQTRILTLRSPGAHALRLHFVEFDVGAGSLVIYAESKDGPLVHGPLHACGPKGDGDFWTASLPGDTVHMELSVGKKEPRFRITELLHFDREPLSHACVSGPLACHQDVACFDGSVHPQARDAVGQMNYISGGSSFVCTGTILNDLDPDTVMPYFLTAHHCLSTQAEVNTLEVVWQWQRDVCGGVLPNHASLPRNMGGTLLATSPTDGGNDMTFIRLDGQVLSAGLAGWTTETRITGVGVHHPCGSWKRITFLSPVGVCPGCLCFSGTRYDYYTMDDGIIQGGSSGSGIFNSSGQLAGQLFGTCCIVPSCSHFDCGASGYRAVYGEFQETFPLIETWLEIGGTIHVDGQHSGTERGTPSQPFNTVGEGNAFGWDGSRLKIRTGTYVESVVFSNAMTVLAEGGSVRIGD